MEKYIVFKWTGNRVTLLWPDYPLLMAGSAPLTIVIQALAKGDDVESIALRIATQFSLPVKDVHHYIKSIVDAISVARTAAGETTRKLTTSLPQIGLSMATFNLTRNCNLRCAHCYLGIAHSQNELSIDQLRTAIIKLGALIQNNPKLLILSGGEPTVATEKLRIAVLTARECGLNPRLNTNGQVISEETAQFLSVNNVLTQVSLDGIDPITNALIRGSLVAFNNTINAIRTLVAAGCRTRISFTVHSANLAQIPGMLSLAEDLGVEQVVFSNMVKIGSALKNGLKSVEYRDEFRILYEAVRFNKDRQRLTRSTLLGETIAAIRAGIRFTYCGTGHSTCCVDADGTVYPCINMIRDEFRELNIKDDDFHQRFISPETWPQIRALDVDTLNSKCARCFCRYFCGGYCRGETLSCGRSLASPYIRCTSWKRGLLKVFDILSETPDIYDFGEEPILAIMHRE
jgi:radical SAM protein with 4Fe4S-binding SPASM domain